MYIIGTVDGVGTDLVPGYRSLSGSKFYCPDYKNASKIVFLSPYPIPPVGGILLDNFFF